MFDVSGVVNSLNKIVEAIKNINSSGEGWHIVQTFLNSWVNYNVAIHNPASYFKDSFGVVHLKGLVKSGTIGQAIFTLPVGYRPNRKNTVGTDSDNAHGRCDICITGDVKAQAGSNAYFSLDGITFRADGY